MLAARIYVAMSLLVLAGAATVHLTESFSFGTTVILGFVASILAGTGMLAVFPAVMTEEVSSRRAAAKETKRKYRSAVELQSAV